MADDDPRERRAEPTPDERGRGERSEEERRRDEIRGEPDREDPPNRPVAGRLRDGIHAVSLDRQVPLPRGHALSGEKPGRHRSAPSTVRGWGSAPIARLGPAPAISGVAGVSVPPPAPVPPLPLPPSRRYVTGWALPSTCTTLRAGSVSATTRPLRTTSRAAGRRRIASASSAQSKTTKFAGLPSAMPYGTSAARAGFVVTIS